MVQLGQEWARLVLETSRRDTRERPRFKRGISATLAPRVANPDGIEESRLFLASVFTGR